MNPPNNQQIYNNWRKHVKTNNHPVKNTFQIKTKTSNIHSINITHKKQAQLQQIPTYTKMII